MNPQTAIKAGVALSESVVDLYNYTGSIFKEGTSIVSLLSPFIIEPTIFVTNSIKNDNPDLLSRAIAEQIDIFCGFYTMAFKVMSELSGTKDDLVLRKLGSNQVPSSLLQNVGGAVNTGLKIYGKGKAVEASAKNAFTMFTTEGYNGNDSGMMRFNEASLLSTAFNISNESNGTEIIPNSKALSESVGAGTMIRFFEIKTSRKFKAKDSNELTSKEVVIPIMVRAHVVFADAEDILDVFELKSPKNSFTQRYWKWRSGGISFKEFIFCTDLINQYRERKINGKTTIQDILSEKNFNATKEAITRGDGKGFSSYYNLYVMSNSDAEYIEKTLKGRFDNPNFTQSALAKLQAMELMILDTEYGMGQMFIHNMPEPSIFQLDKMGKRKENSDLGDLLKSLYANRPPMF